MTTHEQMSSPPRARSRRNDDAVPAPASAGGRWRPTTDPEAAPARGPLRRHGLLAFVLLAYGITWSLFLVGFLTIEAGVLDADGGAIWWINQVAAAGPLIAAVTVVSISRGRAGLAALGRSLVRWRVNPAWYVLAFLGIPLIMVGSIALVYTSDVVQALTADWSLLAQLPISILLVAVITGLAEEPGWRGYAQPAANRRYRPLLAALVVSVAWALWHLPNVFFNQTIPETGAHVLVTVVNGFLLAWAYNATRGSVLIVMLLHASGNATYGLVQRLSEGSAGAPTPTEYYVLTAAVIGLLMTFVALRTRGRLGMPADPPPAR